MVLLIGNKINAQSIVLCDIIKKAYSRVSDLAIINNVELNYVIPRYVSFIDTGKVEAKYPFSILYHINDIRFENHLKKVHNAAVLTVFYDKIYSGFIDITMEISTTKDEQYFGCYKFFTFVDKRQLRLVYNKIKGEWEYSSLIKIFDEPGVGRN